MALGSLFSIVSFKDKPRHIKILKSFLSTQKFMHQESPGYKLYQAVLEAPGRAGFYRVKIKARKTKCVVSQSIHYLDHSHKEFLVRG